MALGSPADVKQTVMRGHVLEIDCDNPALALERLRKLDGLEEVALYGAQVHIVAEDVALRITEIEDVLTGVGITVQRCDVIPPSLEDVFISSMRKNSDPEA